MIEQNIDPSWDIEIRPFAGSPAEWDRLAALYGTIFHSSRWLGVMERTQDARLLRLGVYESGRPIGILPLFVKRYFPLKVGGSALVIDNTPYQGIACEPTALRQAVAAAGSFAKRERIHFLRLFQREHFTDAPKEAGSTYVDKHTHVIDLTQGEDEIWKGMEGRCRTGIRKAEKSGVTVVRETSRECIAPYYDILSALYIAQNMITPNSLAFYEQLWDEFSDRGLYVLTARYENRMIAGAILLHDGDWMYYINGCSLGVYNHLEPNRAVQWTGIRMAKSLRAKRYDFVGSDIPRLAAFKKSFGGDLLTYTLVERPSAPWVVTARRVFPELRQLAHRVRSRLERVSRSSERHSEGARPDANGARG